MKKIWRPVVAIILLFVLIKKGPFDFQQLKTSVTDPYLITIGILLFGFHFLMLTYRWRLFVNEFCTLKIKKALKLTLIGQFFSFFIPGGVGGDVVKALELSKDEGVSRKNSLSTVTADRILGLFSMIFFTAVSLILVYFSNGNSDNKTYLIYSGSFLAVMLVGLFLGERLNGFIKSWLKKKQFKFSEKLVLLLDVFDQTFKHFKNLPFLLKLVFVSLVIQLSSTAFMYMVVGKLFANPPPFLLFFAISCFGFIISSIPITPSGIGVGQTAFYFLFSKINPDLGKAGVIAISLLQLFYLLYSLVGGFLFSRNTKNINKVNFYEKIESEKKESFSENF